MARVSTLVPLLLAFAIAGPYAPAADAATYTFEPAADTFVNQAFPRTNYGGAKRMHAQGGAGHIEASFARFAVSGVSGTVTKATLRLYVANATRNGPGVYLTSASWAEKRLTWKRRPSTVAGPRSDKRALARDRWVAWDVTPWVAGDGKYGFALKQRSADRIGFMTRETTKAPTLVITTADSSASPPPEPECSDGVDNDADGSVDYPDDAGCSSSAAESEADDTPLPPPTPTEPAPIAGQAYDQVFAEDFETFDETVWDRSIWYDDPAAPGDIYAQGGILHLVSRRSSGYPNVTTTTLNSRSFRHGYFEARMRWTKGNGAWPAFWLFSTRHATNPNWPNPACFLPTCLSSELDVFEGQGSEPDVFYGTLHRNSCSCYGVANQQNSNNWQPTGVDLTAGFHTYGALWTATEVRWYLDGVELMRTPTYDSTDQPMFLLLDMWTGGWTRDTDATTPSELDLQVDWVRVWQP